MTNARPAQEVQPGGPPPLDDPVYRHSLREARVILGLWAAAFVYALSVCYLLGYGRDPATLRLVWGIPDWVFFGVVLPWVVCDLFTIWFCFRFMAEDDLSAAGENNSQLPAHGPEELNDAR